MRLAVALCTFFAVPVLAQNPLQGTGGTAQCDQFKAPQGAEQFEDSKYLTGRHGVNETGGTLYLTDSTLLLVEECHAQPTVTVRITAIDSVSLESETRDPSTLSRAAFGLLGAKRRDEILTLIARTSTDVEGLVFRISGHRGAGLAAKITSRRVKLKGTK